MISYRIDLFENFTYRLAKKIAHNYVIKFLHPAQNSMLLMQHEQGMHC